MLARGKWRSEECVCRCYRVLSGEALFHNGLRGWLGQNYSMWERRRKLCSDLYGETLWGKWWVFGANRVGPADCNLWNLPISFNLLYSGFTDWGQVSLLKASRVDTACWQLVWAAPTTKASDAGDHNKTSQLASVSIFSTLCGIRSSLKSQNKILFTTLTSLKLLSVNWSTFKLQLLVCSEIVNELSRGCEVLCAMRVVLHLTAWV